MHLKASELIIEAVSRPRGFEFNEVYTLLQRFYMCLTSLQDHGGTVSGSRRAYAQLVLGLGTWWGQSPFVRVEGSKHVSADAFHHAVMQILARAAQILPPDSGANDSAEPVPVSFASSATDETLQALLRLDFALLLDYHKIDLDGRGRGASQLAGENAAACLEEVLESHGGTSSASTACLGVMCTFYSKFGNIGQEIPLRRRYIHAVRLLHGAECEEYLGCINDMLDAIQRVRRRVAKRVRGIKLPEDAGLYYKEYASVVQTLHGNGSDRYRKALDQLATHQQFVKDIDGFTETLGLIADTVEIVSGRGSEEHIHAMLFRGRAYSLGQKEKIDCYRAAANVAHDVHGAGSPMHTLCVENIA